MAAGENNIFSADYVTEEPISWGKEISAAFAELKRVVKGEVRCVRWNNDYVAAAFVIPIDLPSRGPVGGIDIRAQEPIMLVFSRRDYPEKAPMARSDRKDFPVSRLPHLNPVASGQPPWLCLHRGNFNDWFAEHTLEDMVQRVRNWYRDAAANRLIPEGDYFEPTRLTDTAGTVIFAPDSFEDWVKSGWKSNNGQAAYGFLHMSLLDPSKRDPARDGAFPLRVRSFLHKEGDLAEYRDIVLEYNALVRESSSLAPWCFGILCWAAKVNPITEYLGRLPHDALSLFELCQRINLPLEEALRDYTSRNLALINGVPIILALPRPRPLLNSGLTIEPLCFALDGSDPSFNDTGTIPQDARVFVLDHRTPLIPERARDISGLATDTKIGRVLLFGCGALGSKIALHFGRSGHTEFTYIDHGSLSPHNLVRHSLLSDRVGQNKAEAMKKSVEALYESIPEQEQPQAHTESAIEWLKGGKAAQLANHNLLLDATASGMVLEALVRAELPRTLNIARCGIADLGRIGLLAIEGSDRNPRLDDLNVLVYDMAIDQPPLQEWLKRERKQREDRVGPALEEISIGLSCSSDTMRLSDDVVSWHASTFSIAMRNLDSKSLKRDGGFLVINYLDDEEGPSSLALISEHVPVKPIFVVHTREVKNGRERGPGSWQVRLQSEAVNDMQQRLKKASPKETGGLMIGIIHPKRRIIYVTRIMDAPPDSEGTEISYRRGTRRLPQSVNRIKESSGGLLGFVGDWHSHPRGSGRISSTDVGAMLETKRDFDMAGLPTFILIVTPNKLYAYVSEAE
jgi:Prokaryotic E2 family A/ThiF family/Prokaryotic homologs of the JAB domain